MASVDKLLNQLSAEELEVAARISYDYFIRPDPTKTRDYARLCANRFLELSEGDATKALYKMKDTLQFRTKIDVDRLRTSFATTTTTGSNNLLLQRNSRRPRLPHAASRFGMGGARNKRSTSNNNNKPLEQQIRAKSVYVQGHDRKGRSTVVFIPRHVQGHDAEWTIKHHVYTVERAVACSRAHDKTINAVIDLHGFSLQRAPPTHIGRAFVHTFSNHYSGVIQNVFLVNVPASFLCLWTIVKPWLGKRGRSRVHFVKSSHDDKNAILSKFYDPNQAASWMMKGGRKNRELDVDEYLFKTPFHRAFDE